jgi:hypothetical protein
MALAPCLSFGGFATHSIFASHQPNAAPHCVGANPRATHYYPNALWAKYQVNAIWPVAAKGRHRWEGHASARRTLKAVTATAVPPLASKESGRAGIDSVPNRALTVSVHPVWVG